MKISNEEPDRDAEVIQLIEHHGVKGMKWGVRGSRNRVKVSSDFRKTAPLRNRKTRELSNKQLQSINARINLEQNYRRMNPTKVQVGSAMVKTTLAGLTTAAAFYSFVKSPAGQAFINAGKKAIRK